VRDFSET